MEFKFLLTSFWRLINVLRIAGVQALSVIFVSYAVGEWVVISGFRGCAPLGGYFNLYLWSFLIVGLAATAIGVYYILFPAIWMQSIDKQLVFSATNTNLPFFSTQPVYVFLPTPYSLFRRSLYFKLDAPRRCVSSILMGIWLGLSADVDRLSGLAWGIVVHSQTKNRSENCEHSMGHINYVVDNRDSLCCLCDV